MPLRPRLLLATFALTLFVSATLLFLVEPMVGKMITPLLGGSPAVWNTCMVFFQAALLAGYAYAHAGTARLGPRRQAAWHLGLLLLPLVQLLFVPLGIARGLLPAGAFNPIPWVLALLVLTVGLPFFVVSASAPLLQKWFAATGHPAARDPYFLYGASNLGSMLALVAYPTLIEPTLHLSDQARLWCVGYAVLAGLTALCAWLLWRSPAPAPAPTPEPSAAPAAPPPTVAQRLLWVALAAVPSSLMLGATTYITTDVAAIPLLWVLPLALYLLSFILVFSRLPALVHRVVLLLTPAAVLALLFMWTTGIHPHRLVSNILIHLTVLFLVAMACHGELARRRPDTRYLTQYYLLLSVGGVLGGLCNALVAPLVFPDVLEYPLALVGACLLVPLSSAGRKRPALVSPWLLEFALPVAAGGVALLVLCVWPADWWGYLDGVSGWLDVPAPYARAVLTYGVPGLVCYLCAGRLLRVGLSVGAIGLASLGGDALHQNMMHQERSFFGVLKVSDQDDGLYHRLVHGTTLHGKQQLRWDDADVASFASPLAAAGPLELAAYFAWGPESAWEEPHARALTYYHRTGPIGQVFTAFPDPRRNVAVIGLGTGTLVSYARPGQNFTYYEIDRAVLGIAEDPAYFTFLRDARARGVNLKIVLGDARLMVEQTRLAPEEKYHLLVVDAFTSDAIPFHLITRDAVRAYLTNLAPDGLIAYHISNRYLDLEPVVRNLAASEGLAALVRSDGDDGPPGKETSTWVLLARRPEAFGKLREDGRWRGDLETRPGVGVWTDDFSNVLSVFRWKN